MKNSEIDIANSKEVAMVTYSHLPKTAAEARAKGVKMVFTGTPCRRGHYSPRYATNMNCVACQKQLVKDRRKHKRDEEDKLKQIVANQASEALRAKLEVSILEADNAGLGQAIAAYLINEGAESVIPGVILHAESIIKQTEWLLSALKRAIHHRIAYRDRCSGILFFPGLVISNRPRDESQSRYWRDAFSRIPSTVMTNGIKAMVTTQLIRDRELSSKARDKAILDSWFGNECPADARKEVV